MEFIRIGQLKETLIAGPLSALDTAKYLAVQGALLSILFIPSSGDEPAGWTYAVYPLTAVAGVYYCYKRNGGAAGIRFAERYLAIGWVVGLRMVLFLVLPAFAVGTVVIVALALAGVDADRLGSDRFDHAFGVAGLGLTLLLYWRTGIHLAAVHRHDS